jgi:hypothetical protein
VDAGEIAYPGNPFGLGVRGRDEMASVYITDEDTQLRIVSCNAATGIVVGLQGLRIDENGVPQPIVQLHTPATNRVVAVQNYPIGKGTLLRLTAFLQAGTPIYGQTYVLVQLVRGISGPIQVLATLVGGCLTATQAIGFPGSPVRSSIEGGGYIRDIHGSSPAAGHEQLETVPTNARWELLYIFHALTTVAGGGNRTPNLALQGNGPGAIGVYPNSAQGAATIKLWSWGVGLPLTQVLVLSSGFQVVEQALPKTALLLAGNTWGTSTDGLAAGDQWGAPEYWVREWLEF